jgi:hypothetical protein
LCEEEEGGGGGGGGGGGEETTKRHSNINKMLAILVPEYVSLVMDPRQLVVIDSWPDSMEFTSFVMEEGEGAVDECSKLWQCG